MEKSFILRFVLGAVACIISLPALSVSAQDSADSVETAVPLLEAAADVAVEVTRSPLTDLVSFVATTRGQPIALDVLKARASAPGSAW